MQAATSQLRDIILASPAGARLGSLNDVAGRLSVGVVTLQQAARILEHEGLLKVRRGPGGGYYGARPDDASLQRALAAYVRVHGSAFGEVIDMLTLLDIELMAEAAHSTDEAPKRALESLLTRIDSCDSREARLAFESELRKIVLSVVDRPLLALLAATVELARNEPPPPTLFRGDADIQAWASARKRIVHAIVAGDAGLTRFEATRWRQMLMARLNRQDAPA